MDYEFSKDRLRAGSSHPLRRSLLDAALAEVDTSRLASVSYGEHDSRLTSRLFDALGGVPDAGVTAEFQGEANSEFPWLPGRIRIRVAAVASARRRALEAVLLARAIPALLHWIAAVETTGDAWRASDHWFAAGVKGTAFAVRHDPLPPR